MDKYDIVILGGGPAGVQSVISARSSYPDKSIALIRKDKVSMIPCGIPYIFHSLKSVDKNILPDAPIEKNNVDLIIGEVIGRDGKNLIFADGRKVGYDKLVLASGSKPALIPIPGIDRTGVYTVMKSYEYLLQLREIIDRAKKPLIIGGGYVGVELADELVKAGKDVTLIEMMPSLLPGSMDPEFGDMVRDELEKQGCKVITGAEVNLITGEKEATGADLSTSKHITADAIIVSTGYKPDTDLAEKLGIDFDPKYGVITDEYMQTSEPDIFAAGDCTANRSSFSGNYSNIMLASTAMAQGRLAGSNLYSIDVIKNFAGNLSTFSTKIGDVALGATGLTETTAKKMGIAYFIGTSDAVDRHPGSLPGASKTHTKLLFAEKTHHLLGAQVSGGDSIGELVNMLSVMIQNKMTDMEIDTIQIGTHPLLTPSPLAYPVITATVNGILKWANPK